MKDTAENQKEHTCQYHIYQKTAWWSTKPLGKYYVYWQDKRETFRKVCVFYYIWPTANTAFNKKKKRPTVKQGHGLLMVWGCFAVSGPQWLGVTDETRNSLPENPEGQLCSHQFITIDSSALGLSSRTMIRSTTATPPRNGSIQNKEIVSGVALRVALGWPKSNSSSNREIIAINSR